MVIGALSPRTATAQCPPGFEYPFDVVVEGNAACGAYLAGSTISCTDESSENLQIVLTTATCAANAFSDSAEFLHGCMDAGEKDDGTADASYSVSYALTALPGVISFRIGTLGLYQNTDSRNSPPCSPSSPPIGGGYGQVAYDPFTISVPMILNYNGRITVDVSYLAATGCSESCRSLVNAYWGFSGIGVSITDTYVLNGCGLDEWDSATRTFSIPAGEYSFDASFESFSTGGRFCCPAFCEAGVTCNMADEFRVELTFECEDFDRCDANCDGNLDFFDIDPFLLALFDPAEYAIQYPDCSFYCNNDINGDGSVDFFDSALLEDCLGL